MLPDIEPLLIPIQKMPAKARSEPRKADTEGIFRDSAPSASGTMTPIWVISSLLKRKALALAETRRANRISKLLNFIFLLVFCMFDQKNVETGEENGRPPACQFSL